MSLQTHEFVSKDALNTEFATKITDILQNAIVQKGNASLIVSGGNTPKPGRYPPPTPWPPGWPLRRCIYRSPRAPCSASPHGWRGRRGSFPEAWASPCQRR